MLRRKRRKRFRHFRRSRPFSSFSSFSSFVVLVVVVVIVVIVVFVVLVVVVVFVVLIVLVVLVGPGVIPDIFDQISGASWLQPLFQAQLFLDTVQEYLPQFLVGRSKQQACPWQPWCVPPHPFVLTGRQDDEQQGYVLLIVLVDGRQTSLSPHECGF